jgi:sugar phosphate isomerase/epimerase
MHSSLPRRHFLRNAALAAAAPFVVSPSRAADTISGIPKLRSVAGTFIGPQAWTFNRFTVLEAIEFAGRSGASVIEWFPGQKFSKDGGSWGPGATPEMEKMALDALQKWNITPMNFGVTGIANDETEARKTFDFAKRWGLYGITTESVESVAILEKLAAENDIRVCFHNHPRQPNNPNYKVWDPQFILDTCKDRDPRIGACADTGHWIRSGLNALDAVKLLKSRVLSMHLKDRVDEKGEDVPFGTGKASVDAILTEARSHGFKGNASIEYETNWDHSITDVAQCIGYVRGLGLARGWDKA